VVLCSEADTSCIGVQLLERDALKTVENRQPPPENTEDVNFQFYFLSKMSNICCRNLKHLFIYFQDSTNESPISPCVQIHSGTQQQIARDPLAMPSTLRVSLIPALS